MACAVSPWQVARVPFRPPAIIIAGGRSHSRTAVTSSPNPAFRRLACDMRSLDRSSERVRSQTSTKAAARRLPSTREGDPVGLLSGGCHRRKPVLAAIPGRTSAHRLGV